MPLNREWFRNLGIDHQDENYFDNKYNYIQYILVDSIPKDNMDAYIIYQQATDRKQKHLSRSLGKVYVELTESENLAVEEIFDKITLV